MQSVISNLLISYQLEASMSRKAKGTTDYYGLLSTKSVTNSLSGDYSYKYDISYISGPIFDFNVVRDLYLYAKDIYGTKINVNQSWLVSLFRTQFKKIFNMCYTEHIDWILFNRYNFFTLLILYNHLCRHDIDIKTVNGRNNNEIEKLSQKFLREFGNVQNETRRCLEIKDLHYFERKSSFYLMCLANILGLLKEYTGNKKDTIIECFKTLSVIDKLDKNGNTVANWYNQNGVLLLQDIIIDCALYKIDFISEVGHIFELIDQCTNSDGSCKFERYLKPADVRGGISFESGSSRDVEARDIIRNCVMYRLNKEKGKKTDDENSKSNTTETQFETFFPSRLYEPEGIREIQKVLDNL